MFLAGTSWSKFIPPAFKSAGLKFRLLCVRWWLLGVLLLLLLLSQFGIFITLVPLICRWTTEGMLVIFVSSTERRYTDMYVSPPGNGPQQLLLQGVVNRNFRAVKAALEAGANINGTKEHPLPPITAATIADEFAVVNFLLAQGADPNRPFPMELPRPPMPEIAIVIPGERALHIAARNGYVEVVSLLLKTGRANPNVTEIRGYTPLNATCDSMHGNVDAVVQLLLEAGADPALADNAGCIPLHITAQRGFVGAVDMLCSKAPATVNVCVTKFRTALFFACTGDQEGVVSKLLSAGAMQPRPLVDDGMPLSIAAGQGFVGVVRVLLSERGMEAIGGGGALPNALYAAIHARRTLIIMLLLAAYGEGKRSEWANAYLDGKPMLHYSAGYCYPAGVSILLEAGADETVCDSEGHIPLCAVGGFLGQCGEPDMDRMEEIAVLRMLERGPAYRARSWAWPADEEADAGGGSGDGDAASTADVVPSSPAVKTPPAIGVRIFRPKKKCSRKLFVRHIGRYCAKD